MQHIHFASCGCGDDAKGNLDLFSLNENISRPSIHCLNEKTVGSGKQVLCPYENRLDSQFVTSDSDNELIFRFNFEDEVKLKGLLLRSQYKSRQPRILKIFINSATDIDFSNIRDIKGQEFILQWDPNCSKPLLFRGPAYNNVTSVTIYVSTLLFPNHIEDENIQQDPQLETTDEIVINYIGFLGSYTGTMRLPPKTTYELAPQPGDHQQTEITKQSLGFGL